jgi:hypothetical protein
MPSVCDECYGLGCNVCNHLGWTTYVVPERKVSKVSSVKVVVKKIGQVTQVHAEDKFAYHSGNTVKAEVKNLTALFKVIGVENIEIEER